MDRENTPPHLTGKSLYLPQEIIEEILSALPVKSLLRFRCISKSWCCLIGSERFIKTQLEKSIKDPSYAHWRVAFHCYLDIDPNKRRGLTQCSVESYGRSFFDGSDIHRRPFDDSTNNHLTTEDSVVVGHCNGLLCIVKQYDRLFLWNPTIRISIGLSKDSKLCAYTGKYGFGMDERSGAYKVFAVLCESKYLDAEEDDAYVYDHKEYIGKVYSSKTNSWKTVEQGCSNVVDEAGVLVGGKLHWLMKDVDYIIESFDLSSEVFGMIELPYIKGEVLCAVLTEVSGMLSLIVNYDKEKMFYGEWVRVTKHERCRAEEHWVKVKTKRYKDVLKHIVDYCADTVYVESLVWPVPLK